LPASATVGGMKQLALLTLTVALTVPAAALACGDDPNAINLRLTAPVRAELARAYTSATGVHATAVPGRTYYGTHVGIQYAVATFGPQPAIFFDQGRGKWKLLRVTHGGVCSGVVPIDLIHAWSLVHQRGGCYVEP
jgi:hypothetical protein